MSFFAFETTHIILCNIHKILIILFHNNSHVCELAVVLHQNLISIRIITFERSGTTLLTWKHAPEILIQDLNFIVLLFMKLNFLHLKAPEMQ